MDYLVKLVLKTRAEAAVPGLLYFPCKCLGMLLGLSGRTALGTATSQRAGSSSGAAARTPWALTHSPRPLRAQGHAVAAAGTRGLDPLGPEGRVLSATIICKHAFSQLYPVRPSVRPSSPSAPLCSRVRLSPAHRGRTLQSDPSPGPGGS